MNTELLLFEDLISSLPFNREKRIHSRNAGLEILSQCAYLPLSHKQTSQTMRLLGQLHDLLRQSQPFSPIRGNRLCTVGCACRLAVDRAGGIGIASQVDQRQSGIPKIIAPVKNPQRRIQRLDHITTADDLRQLLALEDAAGDSQDLGCQGQGSRGEKVTGIGSQVSGIRKIHSIQHSYDRDLLFP